MCELVPWRMAIPTHPLTTVVPELDSAIDFEIPPIARCVACHGLDCEGCLRVVPRNRIAWEQEGSLLHRLWATARQSIAAGTRSCLDVERPRLFAAIRFALLAELLACTSVTLVLLVVAQVGAPTLEQVGFFSLVGVGLGVFLVLAHLLWGLGLELALALCGLGFSPKRGLSFALYACGWDLFTSPAGIAAALVSSGPRAGWAQVREAARVPRAALLRYLTESRGASDHQAAFAVRASFLLPVALTVAGLAALLWMWLRATLMG